MDTKKTDEVYVSYNGKETSLSSFISYFIAAFNRHGISAIFDGKSSHVEAEERERVEERFSKLKVFVVVFSNDFVSYLPCLEKHIYSCRNNDNFVVVPVFYGVSKSSVKQHMQNFGDAFEAIRRSMPKLRRGHEYDCERSESEFLEEIAKDVFEKVYPTEEIGIQSEDIVNLLCKQPWGIRTIGIFGESGIGKTTLARAVFRQMSRTYDESCFINDFQTEYNGKTLESLPSKYLSEIPVEKFNLNNQDHVEPCNRRKRVLLVLDDVQNSQDAKSFLDGFDRVGPGSLLIITSRVRQVLDECHVNEIYELKGLNEEDALKLFTRCAYGEDVTKEDLMDHTMKKAIECCKGNPSALRSYAKKVKEAIEVRIVKDDEPEKKEKFPSDHNSVLATSDTRFRFYNRISKSLSSNQRFYRIYFDSGKSFIEHLRETRRYLKQGLATQLQKISQTISKTRDLDQPVLVLYYPGVYIKVVWKKPESNRKNDKNSDGIIVIDLIDQAYRLVQYLTN